MASGLISFIYMEVSTINEKKESNRTLGQEHRKAGPGRKVGDEEINI